MESWPSLRAKSTHRSLMLITRIGVERAMISPTLCFRRQRQHSFKSFALLIVALIACGVLAHAQNGAQKTTQDRGIRRDLETQDSARALGLVQALPGKTKRY